MKRRQLIRNVASASMVTMVGASAAGAAAAERDGGEGSYLAVRQDDGTHEVVDRENGDVEPDCIPQCWEWYCFQCSCDCCECQEMGL